MAAIDKTERLRKALLASGLFDAGWYAAAYPDVALTGMDPLEHFLRIGLLTHRDPGPDFSETFFRIAAPGIGNSGGSALIHRLEHGPLPVQASRVMMAAMALARTGRDGDAMRLARAHLGPEADRPLQLFQANKAVAAGGWNAWLAHLNAYLAPYRIAPVALRDGGSLLHRLTTAPLPAVTGGPKVSIIMPAHDAAATVGAAAGSILRQTWTNLELLIVDDASSDGTWRVLEGLAAADPRVRIRRNPRNVGPYVSKNLALREASGDWITGHDADDWAHPQRIENHVAAVLQTQGAIRAGTNFMLRVASSGRFGNVIGTSPHHSPDGIRRRAFISCLFHRQTMDRQLGFWDSVRFGADGEMLNRVQRVLGPAYRDFDLFAMLCLDLTGSLTNDAEHGLNTASGVSETRRSYNAAYEVWHASADPATLRLDFPPAARPFPVPEAVTVPAADIAACEADETARRQPSAAG
ncbi:glycosyltransferase family 2 protein [Paracoccus siganidrum]|uniref:Glycosyltransferase family 2 protein n=1 Tax=Paracoccus siganidrum TaxID=1276757 RepID=A0A419AAA7_9RHOB|nr:glycosyltransferase family 2 protein [Paracoccus siganidrum]RJL19690.1 glycosyltransferase family 2 protein [Paracoccus siganidrum]RMC35927.1 hypothetical protein C9E82_10620 [Paracoccus siganidrum]